MRHHGPLCPPTTSSFMGTKLNVDATQAATLTLGVTAVKGLLGMLITGKADFSQLGYEAADMVAQSIEHPGTYHAPRYRR